MHVVGVLLGYFRNLEVIVDGMGWTAAVVLLHVLHLVRTGTVEFIVIAERNTGCVGFRGALRRIQRSMIVAQHFGVLRTAAGMLPDGAATAGRGVGRRVQRRRRTRLQLGTRGDRSGFQRLQIVLHSGIGRLFFPAVQRAVAGSIRC